MIALPKYTFINGPKECGKGTLAKALAALTPYEAFVESFAQPTRDALTVTFWPEEFLCGALDLTESAHKRREMPYPRSGGAPNTIRDTMISFSEDWMKPRWGDEIFGALALKRCQENAPFYKRFIFDDCGFTSEVAPIVRSEGPANCLIITLDRPGHSFAGDSRSYVTIPEVRTVALLNDGTMEELLQKLRIALL